MANEQKAVQKLYKKLRSLYPRKFRDRLGESMLQTFDDLYNERKRHTEQGRFVFILWIFLDTANGILREHFCPISQRNIMQNLLKTLGSSALVSSLLILPFIIMEVVNRRTFNEDFPFALFFFMWQLLFAISLILLPFFEAWRARTSDRANAVPAQENALLTNPKSAAMISVTIYLALGSLPLLDALGWVSLDSIFNGPNPEQVYLPGLFIAFGCFWLTVAAGVIASRPIINTQQAGDSLTAHPINLVIVVIFVSIFAFGLASLIIGQWGCFIGVPLCD